MADKFQSTDEYIHSFPEDQQAGLLRLRQAIHEAVPDAEETLSYQLPAFKHHGMLVYYSAYKDHYSISFPPPFRVFEAFEKELANYEVSKTAVKFPYDKPLPLQLIVDMVKYRAAENAEKEMKKRAKK